jgi:hypothetical protein
MMRSDQYIKLQELQEKLVDVFITEADPANWNGAGLKLAEMDQTTRGNAYWCKKNATATLSVIMRTTSLIGMVQDRSSGGGGAAGGVEAPEQDKDEDTLDAEVKKAEKEAARWLAHLQQGGMQKAHGKP